MQPLIRYKLFPQQNTFYTLLNTVLDTFLLLVQNILLFSRFVSIRNILIPNVQNRKFLKNLIMRFLIFFV